MFPLDVLNIIVEYAFEYELLDWVDEKKLNWKYLSKNPAIFKDNKKELRDILIKYI